MDIPISDAATVVTLNPARQIIERGSLAISDGRIARLGHADELRDATADLTIDGRRKIVLPGLVNPHVHLSCTLARGCGDDLPFLRWLPVVYRVEDGDSEEENTGVRARTAGRWRRPGYRHQITNVQGRSRGW